MNTIMNTTMISLAIFLGFALYKKSTRITYNYFKNILDAIKYMITIKSKKLKRNYIINNENIIEPLVCKHTSILKNNAYICIKEATPYNI